MKKSFASAGSVVLTLLSTRCLCSSCMQNECIQVLQAVLPVHSYAVNSASQIHRDEEELCLCRVLC